jgi:hypothetical protein
MLLFLNLFFEARKILNLKVGFKLFCNQVKLNGATGERQSVHKFMALFTLLDRSRLSTMKRYWDSS